ncbi:CinA family protein [Stieleria varia]|uniref:Nicotinamide-nucleotide amidohydrolase PncC n=1 Tax=Stieleria varia TaxID=2528005 RepID=A0A5C5ZZ32_9BACT|nr:CinA family protein [Stieleria varia]TWT92824.1 Nicotinamide-nucleotide amidohydrolase PncC [Stieleria varia]
MTTTSASDLKQAALLLAEQLAGSRTQLVLAESCTAGLAAASLATVPGISSWLCGSAVVYQEATKSQWLEVSPEILNQFTAVSPQVAQQMAVGALRNTRQADIAGSITGHLGPGAPPEQDGQVFIGFARRTNGDIEASTIGIRLRAKAREDRQVEAARELLGHILGHLKPHSR